MNRIIKIGMDVHSKNYTLCAVEPRLGEEEQVLFTKEVAADYKEVLKFISLMKKSLGKKDSYDITCGYEAGCLGYSLYHQLTKENVHCVILAPSTMLTSKGKRIKTDSRDARLIASCLANGKYSAVHIPTKEENAVTSYIRMRTDHKISLKKLKQQINAFCLKYGFYYVPAKWTQVHLKWLKNLQFDTDLEREVLDEYLDSYYCLQDKINRLDARIQELSQQKEYASKVKELSCFRGIKAPTALALVVEVGDFSRFLKARQFAAYLGLVPGEHSSGDDKTRLSLTKAGNSHLRMLLVEASSSLCRGKTYCKSKALRKRQEGNEPDVIAYADKANRRLHKKYDEMIERGKTRNVAVAAVARELACFIWGMMNGKTDLLRTA